MSATPRTRLYARSGSEIAVPVYAPDAVNRICLVLQFAVSRYRHVLIPLCAATLLFAASDATAQAFRYQWNIRDIVTANSDVIELRTRERRLVGKVSSTQMRVLYAVKSSIEAVAELPVELLIVDGKEPNAFAGKGRNGENIIGINLAMLDILGLDVHAAAALIGHEVAHLKLGHGAQRAAQQRTSGIMKVLGGVALDSLGVPAGGLISDITVTAIDSTYSRDNEREADYLGAIWAVEANYEADGAARLHEAMYAKSRHSPTPFLSTHPSGPERIANLRKLAARLSVTTAP
jgi:Zn-dependent protease with chaperone function